MSPRKPKTKGKQIADGLATGVALPNVNHNITKAASPHRTSKATASLNAPEQNNSLPQGPVVAKEPKRTAPVVEDAKNQQSGGQQQENTEAGKSKAQLRAERRQIQEAQRAAKAAKQQQQPPQQPQNKQQQPQNKQQQQQSSKQLPASSTKTEEGARPSPGPRLGGESEKKKKNKKKTAGVGKESEFSHMQEFKVDNGARDHIERTQDIHPSIISLGLRLTYKKISDPWLMVKALAITLREFIQDFEPSDKGHLRNMSMDLLEELKPQIAFLNACRPLTVGMENLLKHFKYCIKMEEVAGIKDLEMFKSTTCRIMDHFHNENLKLAQKNVSDEFSSSLQDDEVIVVYSYTRLVLKCLYDAKKDGKRFKVIIADQGDLVEGREMARCLLQLGVKCTLCLTSQVHAYMKEATRVILAAEAAFINGNVLTRSGGTLLALKAFNHNVPVVVLCETFRFTDSKPIDSRSFNVIDKTEGEESPSLLHDVVPEELVSGLLTEMGFRSPQTVERILKNKWASTYMIF